MVGRTVSGLLVVLCLLVSSSFGLVVFVQQPVNTTGCTGTETTLSVTATGAGSLSYQWYFQSSPLTGFNDSTFVLSSTQQGDQGFYFVEVTDAVETVASDTVYIDVIESVSVLNLPTIHDICEGESVSLLIQPSGGGTYSYSWEFNGEVIVNATSSSLVYTPAATGVVDGYLSNECSLAVYSGNTVNVRTYPYFISHPQDTRVCGSGTATSLSVNVSGTSPISYEWLEDGATVGSDSDQLDITVTSPHNYRCIATNECGETVSTLAYVGFTNPITINTQPQTQTACQGDPVALSVSAASDGPVTYTWRQDGVIVSGATTNTLSIPSLSSDTDGTYIVSLSNNCSATNVSDAAVVTMNTIPSIITDPTDMTICYGVGGVLSVTAGGGSVGYQWYNSSVAMAGETTSTLSVDPYYASSYHCEVTNGCGSTSTRTAVVDVAYTPPTITSLNAPSDVCDGVNVGVSVSFTGASAFQWLSDGVPIPGATSASTIITPSAGVDYSCQVTNACGSVTSPLTTWTVKEVVTITSQPEGDETCSTDDVTLTVGVNGGGPFSYEWYYNGEKVSGYDKDSLKIPKSGEESRDEVYVVVSNGCSEDESDVAVIATSADCNLVDKTKRNRDIGVAVGVTVGMLAIVVGAGAIYVYKLELHLPPEQRRNDLEFDDLSPPASIPKPNPRVSSRISISSLDIEYANGTDLSNVETPGAPAWAVEAKSVDLQSPMAMAVKGECVREECSGRHSRRHGEQ